MPSGVAAERIFLSWIDIKLRVDCNAVSGAEVRACSDATGVTARGLARFSFRISSQSSRNNSKLIGTAKRFRCCVSYRLTLPHPDARNTPAWLGPHAIRRLLLHHHILFQNPVSVALRAAREGMHVPSKSRPCRNNFVDNAYCSCTIKPPRDASAAVLAASVNPGA